MTAYLKKGKIQYLIIWSIWFNNPKYTPNFNFFNILIYKSTDPKLYSESWNSDATEAQPSKDVDELLQTKCSMTMGYRRLMQKHCSKILLPTLLNEHNLLNYPLIPTSKTCQSRGHDITPRNSLMFNIFNFIIIYTFDNLTTNFKIQS